MAVLRSLLLLLLVYYHVAPARAASWRHDFATASAASFADFRSPTNLTDPQLAFASDKYRVVSLEKCSGKSSGMFTEDYIYSTAARLKARDPTTKVVFYWATNVAPQITCYRAHAEFAAHPEWQLKLDNGTRLPFTLDWENPDAREWWTSVPLGGQNGTGLWNGVPVHTLIDGVLADGSAWSHYDGVALPRLEQLYDAHLRMIGQLQAAFDSTGNGGVVMANAISMYGGVNQDPRPQYDHGAEALDWVAAAMNEHTAAFESVNRNNASLNVETVKTDMEVIDAALRRDNGSKLVFVQTWPGLYAGVQSYSPVANGGEPTPTTIAGWRNALRSHFAFAQALFLSVAEPNAFWFYGATWYESHTGYIDCPEDRTTCPTPPEWYPDLQKPLGPPLGPRVEVSPYVWRREFAHASVLLDLNMPNRSSTTYHDF